MSKLSYFLKPVKAEGEEFNIEIPYGKVTIGRGPFLKCVEKRVSRAHAELNLTVTGELTVTPLHTNPTYLKTLDSVQTLEKGKSHILKSGDVISLLENSLEFEIISKSERNSQSMVSDDVGLELRMDGSSDKPDLNASINENDCNTLKVLNSNENDQIKVRTLPDWMVEASQETPQSNKPAPKKRAVNSNENTPSTKKNKTVKVVPSDDSEANEVLTSTPKKRGGTVKFEQLEDSEANGELASSSKNRDDIVKHELSDDSEDVIDNGAPLSSKTETVKENKKDSSDKKRRKICEYGNKCYRKNPSHKEEFSHPGDDDYDETIESEESGEDDRPECEYGIDCYRKNPSHRKEYKHTQRPKRKAVIKAKKKNAEKYSDEDEDEYDESFIDDDEDNYDPKKDKESYSTDEDLDELNAEAKSFIKNKKMYAK